MIRLEGLTKAYGKFIAVNEIDLHVPRGELFGFLGPNGAGKTTTLRLLLGLLDCTAVLRRCWVMMLPRTQMQCASKLACCWSTTDCMSA